MLQERLDAVIVFPAHAGVIPKQQLMKELEQSIPRTRGGDPNFKIIELSPAEYSPHTRG